MLNRKVCSPVIRPTPARVAWVNAYLFVITLSHPALMLSHFGNRRRVFNCFALFCISKMSHAAAQFNILLNLLCNELVAFAMSQLGSAAEGSSAQAIATEILHFLRFHSTHFLPHFLPWIMGFDQGTLRFTYIYKLYQLFVADAIKRQLAWNSI